MFRIPRFVENKTQCKEDTNSNSAAVDEMNRVNTRNMVLFCFCRPSLESSLKLLINMFVCQSYLTWTSSIVIQTPLSALVRCSAAVKFMEM